MKSFKKYTLGDLMAGAMLDEDDLYEGEKKVTQMTPQELVNHRNMQTEGKKWLAENPVHHMNIVHHYNQATENERHVGDSWYKDASHLNKVLAADAGVHPHVMAGLISNYSPQTHWATNLMTASKVARTGKALGGPGDGVFASKDQKNCANRLLAGEHYNDVLKGHKTKYFAHLVEHGGQTDEHNKVAVVDRHAYSVAANNRITDAAFGYAGLKSHKGYHKVMGEYAKAAEHLSNHMGRKVDPEQVQATTWLVRQRLNVDHEHATSGTGTSRTKVAGQASKKNWDAYAGEHHPSIVGLEPGTGYSGK